EGPSGVDHSQGHGLFALGLLQVFQQAGLGGDRYNRAAPYTLDQFKTALRAAVLNLSERRQEAFCFIPLEVPERSLLAQPQRLSRCRDRTVVASRVRLSAPSAR